MIFIKTCKKCKKIIIIKNDNTANDKIIFEKYKINNLLCKC